MCMCVGVCVCMSVCVSQLRESWVELQQCYKHENQKQIQLPTLERTNLWHGERFYLFGLSV